MRADRQRRHLSPPAQRLLGVYGFRAFKGLVTVLRGFRV